MLGNDSDPDGQQLSAVLVSGPSQGALTLNSNGSFAYTPNADYFGIDSFNYKANNGSFDSLNIATVAITVMQKTKPDITWSNPADIVYGTVLSGTQLNAVSSVPGTFTYAPSTGTVLNAGSGQTLSAAFAPADAANYNSAAATVTINVLKATPFIIWSNPADIIFGTTLSAVQLNATGSVPGTFTYTPPAGTVLNVGSGQRLTATFTPSDTANYSNATASVVVNAIYDFGAGFLAPVDLDRPFMLGSTIPIKFRLADATGAPIANAHVTLRLQKYSSSQPEGDPIDATPTGAADSGNVFQYDGSAQYHYNLSTKGLSVGTWSLQAFMDDGTVKSIFIMIKDN